LNAKIAKISKVNHGKICVELNHTNASDLDKRVEGVTSRESLRVLRDLRVQTPLWFPL